MTDSAAGTDPGTAARAAPAWTEHVIWWHVYPLGFAGADTTGADRTPTHRLRDLVPWLDHLVALGANGLALGPIFASSTHGYDTLDWFAIDARLGDEADFAHLIEEAHARGIRVMLDGVFNHVGRDFADSALFARDATGELGTFEGHDALVALDHANPVVADTVVDVMNHWLDRGADAWRLDAAYSVPSAFWARVLPRVRERHASVLVVGEVLHGDYAAAVQEGTLDTVTQYELWQGIWHGIDEVNLFELDWALTRHNGFLDTFVPYTFIGNHDVTRLATIIGDERHHGHALALLLALGGMPSVYYGDEFGLRALKEERFGGDDAIRPAFPVLPEGGAGAIDSVVAGLPGAPTDAGASALALHRELIGVRRRHPWLHAARSRTLVVTNETLVLEVRAGGATGAGGGADSDAGVVLVVALNLGDRPLEVPNAGAFVAGRASGLRDDVLVVGAHGWAITER